MTVSTDPPQRPAKTTPVSDNHAARSYKPTPQQTRMQFDWVKFQRSLKTAQFQRCYFKIRKGRGGIACKIGCGLRNVGSDHSMRVLRDGEGLATVPVGDVRPEQAHAHQASPGGRRGAWPPPTGTHSGPAHQGNPRGRPEIRRCPEHQRDLIVEMGGIEPPAGCFWVCGVGAGKGLDFATKSRFFCLALNGCKTALCDVVCVSRDTRLKSPTGCPCARGWLS